MKKVFLFVYLIIQVTVSFSQQNNSPLTQVDPAYFITQTREDLIRKLVDLPCGIMAEDPLNVIIKKIESFLVAFIPEKDFADDEYARAANIQALKSVMQGGYGIGSVLIDQQGRIIAYGHNTQIQKERSDLHAEMTLMTNFEKSHKAKKFMNLYVYKPGLTVFSSAEPCPMCFIRISTTGADTKYCAPGPEDGMVTRVNCLPPSWQELALKNSVEIGDCSPIMQKLSHLLFYSYLLDNRGPH